MGNQPKVARTHPKHTAGLTASESFSYIWEYVDEPIALTTVMRPRGFVIFTSSTISRVPRELFDLVSFPRKKVGLLGCASDKWEKESNRSYPSIRHPSGVSEYA